MKIMLNRNDNLIEITRFAETKPIKFLNGTDLVVHEDNLAYFLDENQRKKFKENRDFIFKTSSKKVNYVLDAFLTKPELLKLDEIKLEEAIQEENEKQLKQLEVEKELREKFQMEDSAVEHLPKTES